MTTPPLLTEQALALLLHDWTVEAEHDGGYVLGRCTVCGQQELLDLTRPRSA